MADPQEYGPRGPNLRWLWLVYLVFFLMGPLLAQSLRAFLFTMVGIAVFLPIYALAPRAKGGWVYAAIGGMLALGLLFAKSNPGASVFFVYAAAECGRLGRVRARQAIAVVMLVIVVVAAAWQQHPFFWIPALALVFVIGTATMHEFEVEQKNLELRQSREEVAELARIAERERIARDLHDLLGHTLSVVILKSELARKLAERDPVRAAAEIGEVEAVARQALTEVRAAVSAYRSRSFAGELDNARRVLSVAGVALEVETEGVVLPALHEGVLALSLREAVTNVLRHAHATSCRVALRADAGSVRLVVEDNGRGGGAEGVGLRGMRERALVLGGSVERSVGPGTRLAVDLPLPVEA